MHNLRGYDSHLIINEMHKVNSQLKKPISGIPNSYEKFMSISLGYVKFIDSFQFLSESLDTLVKNMIDEHSDDKYIKFKHMRSHFPDHMDILCQKGYYPYEWVDDIDKLNHIGLPEIADFYTSLKREHMKTEEYQHAQHVYKTMKCKSFGDYHYLYLKCDVLLLADVFENFRDLSLEYYKLDPAHYLTLPSLAWDALLLKTNIQLDLITDLKIADIIERQKRGGLCFVGSKRHVEANNKYMPTFDSNKPSSYLMYWDANALYAAAMCKYLPYKNLAFVTGMTLDRILAAPANCKYGYIVECDLYIPKKLHKSLKEYPPAPETMTPNIEWFSEYQKTLGENSGIINNNKYSGSDKLIPHLFEKKNYVLHYENLKFLVKLGVEVTNVHQVLSFEQKPWMKEYIEFNNSMRAKTKVEAEKAFFKLMNNAVFGKTMENVKNRMDLKLSTDDDNSKKLFTKNNFKDCRNINGLNLIEMYKKNVLDNKHVYVGKTILDLSKVHMMNFHYNVTQKNFKDKHHLLYSDTDSLIYEIMTDDIYDWCKKNKQYFDLSECKRKEIHSDENKKILGMFKDELHGLIMIEFIGLTPKIYSYNYLTLTGEVINKKTLKGISKTTVEKDINHNDYVKTKESSVNIEKDMTTIRSFKHRIYTIKQTKTALSSFYDKMRMIDDSNCVPFGFIDDL